jgi:hypothetical protein
MQRVGNRTKGVCRVGTRSQVMHGNAKMTGGGLKKKDLKYNKQGKIVSKKMSAMAKKEKRLQKAGYTTKKGQFGAVKIMKGGDIWPNIYDKGIINSLLGMTYDDLHKTKIMIISNATINKYTRNVSNQFSNCHGTYNYRGKLANNTLIWYNSKQNKFISLNKSDIFKLQSKNIEKGTDLANSTIISIDTGSPSMNAQLITDKNINNINVNLSYTIPSILILNNNGRETEFRYMTNKGKYSFNTWKNDEENLYIHEAIYIPKKRSIQERNKKNNKSHINYGTQSYIVTDKDQDYFDRYKHHFFTYKYRCTSGKCCGPNNRKKPNVSITLHK